MGKEDPMNSEAMELRYLDLKNDICQQIYEGAYQNGEKIASERQLALDYNVSRITVRKALEILEEDGLVAKEARNGTRITLNNYGNDTPLDMIALVAPAKNPFFARFIAEFQKCIWEQDALLLYVEAPELIPLEDCLYRLYNKNIRNAVVWPDDQTLNPEKLHRLRSIGMNLVFFDTDDAVSHADCVFLDNEDAVKTLLEHHETSGNASDIKTLFVGWDNWEISNVRKREAAFRRHKPDGQILNAPWRRDRKVAAEALRQASALAKQIPGGLVVCETGEIGQQVAGQLLADGLLKTNSPQGISLAVIDDFEGSEHYPVTIYNQDLPKTARKIFRQLQAQVEHGREWTPSCWPVKGNYFTNS